MCNFSLRPLEEKDAAPMVEWLTNEDVTKYLSIGGDGANIESTLAFIHMSRDESINLHRAIVDANDKYLGTVSLKNIDNAKKEAEYAIAMHHEAIGTGAAACGSKLIIALAFEQLNLQRVYLNVLRVNQRAVRFYDKLGFVYTHSTTTVYDGAEVEMVWYEIVKK